MKKLTTEIFIEKALKIHGDIYDYSKVIYKDAKTKVNIICKLHGTFLQSPNDHLSKKGCVKCGIIRKVKKRTKSKEYFLERVIKIHENKYNYDYMDYKNSLTKIKIICPEHGVFEKIPWIHLTQGCPKCVQQSWVKDYWVKKAIKNKKAILYVLEVFNENEKFIKIGITFRGLKKRYCNKNMPYNYKIKYIYVSSPSNIWDEEYRLHNELKLFKYFPLLKFVGNTEGYTLDCLPITFS